MPNDIITLSDMRNATLGITSDLCQRDNSSTYRPS
jgi:hypothetical protein